MADKVVGVKLETDSGQAISSVRNFKKELKEAQAEVVAMAEKFGETSKEAAAAAKRAAELHDAIGDAKSLTDAFNPDTKFRALASSINTVVGGFTAVQGAMGLIGVKSEATEKALLKVQSALALSQGVAQLQEGVKSFKDLGAVIQSTTVFQKANAAATAVTSTVMKAFGVNVVATSTAFNVLKGAIIATGIGALVIGLTAVVQSMDLFSNSTDKAAEAQARLKAEIDGVNELLADEDKIMSNNQRLAIAEAKGRGATAAQIFKIEQSYLEEDIRRREDALKQISDQNSEGARKILQQIDDLNVEKRIREINFETSEKERKKRAAEKEAAEQKKSLRNEDPLRLEKDPLGRIQGLKIEIPKTEKQLQIENEENALLKAAATNKATKALIADTDKEATRIHKENVDERIRDEQAELQAKEQIANAGISILNSLSSLVGSQTKTGKVIALAEIAAGTAKGFINALNIAQQSAKGTGPAAAFAFPVFYATQVAAVLSAVAKAKSILGSSGGTGAGSGPSPSLSVSAPLQPAAAVQQSTRLDQQSLNALNNATTRAYILEADVSNNIEKVKRLNRAARIGG